MNSLPTNEESGKPIEICALAHRKVKVVLDIIDVVSGGILAESDGRFLIVDLLPGSPFIHNETIFDEVTISAGGFEEDQVVVREEKVSDHGATSSHPDTLRALIGSVEIENGR